MDLGAILAPMEFRLPERQGGARDRIRPSDAQIRTGPVSHNNGGIQLMTVGVDPAGSSFPERRISQ